MTWLKEAGKGYQTRANRILRTVMEAQRKKGMASSAGRKRSGTHSPPLKGLLYREAFPLYSGTLQSSDTTRPAVSQKISCSCQKSHFLAANPPFVC
ncbi:hypothetical protein [Geomonas anaerohicana]|uniref:hypothetical protein n=1 Tax=Geomonas anaerohicana TaxID=2798583 RepID=UPI002E281F6C|nr:hypothetical protein [Geomonas anaerohicana]